MWTLMVWLYNLQDKAPQYVIFAALTLAALPTLLVFLLAQKVIMRGIILPSFK
jgi:multiple sugar transport system permease protein